MGHKMRMNTFQRFLLLEDLLLDASLSPTLNLSGHEYSSAKATKCLLCYRILFNFHMDNPELASSPGHSHVFNVARRKEGGPGI